MSAIAALNTNAIFDMLLSRWSALPETGVVPGQGDTEHMASARCLLVEALARYLPWLEPADLVLYERLLQARDADELSGMFFRCFDLLVRVRGVAVGVLRAHELFKLLQPHVTR